MKKTVYKNHSRRVYNLTDKERENYRRISLESRLAKLDAIKGLHDRVHNVNIPALAPETLMPQLERHDLTALSLFSGGGGLDLGVDRAGFQHIASYELIPICRDTLLLNRPDWTVYGGPEQGDVTQVDWTRFRGQIDLVHGGPPCQPFSIAGEQKGHEDERNMWGEFNRAVNTIRPQAFIAENVLGLLSPKFEGFVKKYILGPLSNYHIVIFQMCAPDFGVPQVRNRVFFVGFRNKKNTSRFRVPEPTHSWRNFAPKSNTNQLSLFADNLPHTPHTMGVREALGLPDIGFDNLGPTIRSGFTGKRNTTSILNSSAGQKSWGDMKIWPNGVQADRNKASAFPAKDNHFRLSVQDVALLQGFPDEWKFAGAVYQILGQIGNSVAPPVAYNVAKNLFTALSG
jgi:DNA (cytosine-5)-methyltransferase 1